MSITEDSFKAKLNIYPNFHQAETDAKRQFILIGLGGTGLRALRAVREEEYRCLRSGNESTPGNIHYFCIDSDEHDLSRVSDFFTDDERFLLSRSSLTADNNRSPKSLGKSFSDSWRMLSVGGEQGLGHALIHSNAVSLCHRLRRPLAAGLEQDAHVSIYIVSSLEGSTGCALVELSYIVLDLIDKMGRPSGEDISINGLFTAFGITRQFTNNAAASSFLYTNAANALLELDQCMNLKESGGRYFRTYNTFRIDRHDPPLDRFFLFPGHSDISDFILSDVTYGQPFYDLAIDNGFHAFSRDEDRISFGSLPQLYARDCYNQQAFRSMNRSKDALAAGSFRMLSCVTFRLPFEQVYAALYISLTAALKEKTGKNGLSTRCVPETIVALLLKQITELCTDFVLPDLGNRLYTILNSERTSIPSSWSSCAQHHLEQNLTIQDNYIQNTIRAIEDFIPGEIDKGPQSPAAQYFKELCDVFTSPEQSYLLINELSGDSFFQKTDQLISHARQQSLNLQAYTARLKDDIDGLAATIANSFFPLPSRHSAYRQLVIDYQNTRLKEYAAEGVLKICKSLDKKISFLRESFFKLLARQIFRLRETCFEDLKKCWNTCDRQFLLAGLFAPILSVEDFSCLADFRPNDVMIRDFLKGLLDEAFNDPADIGKDYTLAARVAEMILTQKAEDIISCRLQEKGSQQYLLKNYAAPLLNEARQRCLTSCPPIFRETAAQENYLFVPMDTADSFAHGDKYRLPSESIFVIVSRIRGCFRALVAYGPATLGSYIDHLVYRKKLLDGSPSSADGSDIIFSQSSFDTAPENEGSRTARLLRALDEGRSISIPDEACFDSLTSIHIHNYVPGRSLRRLSKLRSLKLSGSFVHKLPEDLACLHFLEVLDISYTGIRNLSDEILKLTNLVSLNLSGLKLSEFPVFLLDMPLKFTRTGSSGIIINKIWINDLPDTDILLVDRAMTRAWFRTRLQAKDNPVSDATIAVSQAKPPAVNRSASNDMSADYPEGHPSSMDPNAAAAGSIVPSYPDGEVKVVILGDATIGKTLTIRRILKAGELVPDYYSNATRGINIDSHLLDTRAGRIRVSFWDFGGQDIYYAMHRLFFTTRTIYIVMVSARQTRVHDAASSWLENVTAFAPGCPILLYVNQTDQIAEPDLRESELMIKYPALKGVSYMSALKHNQKQFSSEAIDPIITLLEEQKDSICSPHPESWRKVRSRIEASGKHYLTDREFSAICGECGVSSDRSERTGLLEWLSDLGIGFSGSPKHLGEFYTVLDPRWITRALYFMVDYRSFFKNGIVSPAACYNLQEAKKNEGMTDVPDYSFIDYRFILEALQQFRLAYLLRADRYFVPMLCQSRDPGFTAPLAADEKALHFYMSFRCLPVNLLYRLCVEMSASLVSESLWPGGCLLEIGSPSSRAAVTLDENTLHLFILSTDRDWTPRILLAHLRQTILVLARQMGLTVKGEYLVYRADGKEDVYNYRSLLKALEHGASTAVPSHVFGSMKASDILFQTGGLMTGRREALLDDLTAACRQLQENEKYAVEQEDPRTAFLCAIMKAKGHAAINQTTSGVSGTGNSAGRVDAVFGGSDRPEAICEALNFKHNTFINNESASDYLDSHIKKLLNNYNPRGLPLGFLVTYLNCRKNAFRSFWNEYVTFVTEFHECDTFTVTDHFERDCSPDTFLKVLEVRYDCGGISFTVFHIVVRLMTEELSKDRQDSEIRTLVSQE